MSEERFDLVIRGQRILTTAGIAAREVGVRGGKIVAIEPLGNGLAGTEVIELADDETLLPGLVDTHVHVNEPGRTEWEGFASATRAAAAGGVTTIIDMPLNSIPPTTNVDGLKLKREVAEDQAFVDVGFWGGAIPGNKADLRPPARRRRVRLQVLPAALRRGRVPAPGSGRDGRGHGRAQVLRLAHDRPRRGLARDRPRTAPGRRPLLHVPGVPPARRREQGHRRGHRAGPLDRRPRAHPAPVLVGRAAHDRHGKARRRPPHRGDLPALPHADGRGNPRRRHRVQVLPAHPRGLQPRAAVAGPAGRHHRLHRLGPLPLHP